MDCLSIGTLGFYILTFILSLEFYFDATLFLRIIVKLSSLNIFGLVNKKNECASFLQGSLVSHSIAWKGLSAFAHRSVEDGLDVQPFVLWM